MGRVREAAGIMYYNKKWTKCGHFNTMRPPKDYIDTVTADSCDPNLS